MTPKFDRLVEATQDEIAVSYWENQHNRKHSKYERCAEIHYMKLRAEYEKKYGEVTGEANLLFVYQSMNACEKFWKEHQQEARDWYDKRDLQQKLKAIIDEGEKASPVKPKRKKWWDIFKRD